MESSVTPAVTSCTLHGHLYSVTHCPRLFILQGYYTKQRHFFMGHIILSFLLSFYSTLVFVSFFCFCGLVFFFCSPSVFFLVPYIPPCTVLQLLFFPIIFLLDVSLILCTALQSCLYPSKYSDH